MTNATIAGALLIIVPIGFNVAFSLLAARFDYPDVLRRPTSEVLGLSGWKVAEKLTPTAYIAWSLWLIGTGVAFLV